MTASRLATDPKACAANIPASVLESTEYARQPTMIENQPHYYKAAMVNVYVNILYVITLPSTPGTTQ